MSAHVSIELDQPRQLLFNMKAVKSLVQKVGDLGLVSVIERLQGMHIQTLEHAVWAGLLHQEPALSLAVVQKRIAEMDEAGKPLGQLFADTVKALSESNMFKMGKAPEDNEGNVPQEQVTH